MFCTNCGHPIADDARFCSHCGHPVAPASPVVDLQPVTEDPAPEPASEAPVPEPLVSVLAPEAPIPEVLAPVPAPEAPAPAAPVPESSVPVPAPTAFPAEAPCEGQYAPPPPPPDFENENGAPKKKRTLIFVLVIAAALLLAAAAFLAYRHFSGSRAFQADMTAGEEYMDKGDYDQAADAFARALERKPQDVDAALSLSKAYLCAGRFDDAGALLDGLTLDESDERLPVLDRLTALAGLDPAVEQVDVSTFPVITLVLSRGSDLHLTSDNFTITEGGDVRKIAGLEQTGGSVRVSYRSEDTDESDEVRSLNVTLNVDGVAFRDSASYTTPHFEPAQLTLVSSDVSEYPTVKAFFRVTNAADGETIDGLGANSFTILERTEGGEYLVREVRSAVPLEGSGGLNIDLVADKSDSVSADDMEKIRSVMAEFVHSLNYDGGDRAELLAFDSIVQQMCYYTSDAALLTNGIYNMSTDGMTAFYDAVYDGVTNASLQGGARCVIAFTDGIDNRSRHTADEVVHYANSRQVPVYIIGVGRSVETGSLRAMAQDTGARYWHIDDLYDLSEIFNEIYSEQKELYVVEYESDAALDSYLARDLNVQMSGEGFRAKEEVSFTPVRSIRDNGGFSHTSRYQLFQECLSWEDASRRCQEMGGHLATITSQEEMDLLSGMAEEAGAKYVWLGGYTSYDNDGGVFGHWVTGEDFSYQAWAADEPSRVDQDGTEEWYIMLWNIPSLGGWTWNDQRNDPAAAVASMKRSMAFICEFET